LFEDRDSFIYINTQLFSKVKQCMCCQ